jgi:hypothetical protein
LPGSHAHVTLPGMWPAGSADDEFFRRVHPPENEMPVAVPFDVLLARTDDVAVALMGLRVYSTGLALTLSVRVRPRAAARVDVEGLFFGPGRRGGTVLLGVELADGRRATSLDGPGPHDLVFTQGSGSGSPTAVDQDWWLNPLPPDGPLRFVVRSDALGIPDSHAELDGTAIRRAAEGVVVLWPWEPPPSDPPGPRAPDLPPDSWFSG